MAVKGQPTLFYDKANAILEIDGMEYAGFKTCSEVGEKNANISHREGGGGDALNQPSGTITREPITLERGFSDNTELHDWFKAIRDKTLSREEIKRNGRIIQKDEAGQDMIILDIGPCYPPELIYGGWDKDAVEPTIEKCILVWDGPLERLPA